MIKVTCEVPVYEEDGKGVLIGNKVTLEVASHWNRDTWVILKVGGQSVAVRARDLIAAIRNAMNTER